MKIAPRIIFCFCLLLPLGETFAYPFLLSEVVVAEDRYDGNISRSFPCIASMGVIFCDPTLVALEKTCRETLVIKETTLSCKSLSGDFVEFGQIIPETEFSDYTQEALFGHSVKYSSRVSAVNITTPNGNKELQIIVK